MKIRHITLWLLLTALGAGAAAQETRSDLATDRARLEQEVLPRLAARKQRAQARAQAAKEYFSDQGAWQEAFPELTFAPLAELSFLRVQQRRLAEQALEREAARVASTPPPKNSALEASDIARWRGEVLATLDAEEQADILKSRFLRGLEAGLARAPGLRFETFASLELQWTELRRLEEPDDPEDPSWQSAARRADVAGEATALAGHYQQAAWRAMTRPGDDALSLLVEADLDALESSSLPGSEEADEVLASARRELLERVRPLVGEPLRRRIELVSHQHRRRKAERRLPALREQIAALEAFDPTAPPQNAAKRLDALTAELKEINTALAKWQTVLATQAFANDPEVAALEEERATLEIRSLNLQSEVARRHLERGRRLAAAGLDPLQVAAATRAQSKEAQRKAEAARREAEGETQPLKQEVADLRTRTAEILEKETTRHERALHDLETFQQALEERRREHLAILALSPLADERKPRIDTLYVANHTAIAGLRRWLAEERAAPALEASEDQKQFSALARDLPTGDTSDQLLAEWSAAEEEYFGALATQQRNRLAEQDAARSVLVASQRHRRALSDMASSPVRLQVREDFARDVREEIHEIPELLAMHRRRLARAYLQIPQYLRDFNLLQSLITSGTALLFLLWLWWAMRRSSKNWLELGLRSLTHRLRNPDSRAGSLGWQTDPTARAALAKSAAPVLRRLVDLGALSAFYFGFVKPLPLLALPVLLLSLWALYRLVPDTVELAIAIPGERRPGLLITSAESRRRAVGSARWLCAALLGYGVLLSTVRDVFAGDRLAEVVARLLTLLFLVLIAMLLLGWYPTLRRHTAIHLPAGRLQRWFEMEDVGLFGRLLRSVCGVLFLLALAGAHLADRYGNFEWLETFIARRELQQAGSVKRPLSPTVRTAIRRATSRWVPPTAEIDRLLKAWQGWQEDRRRGLVVLIGGRGTGKSTFLEHIPQLLRLGTEQLETSPEGEVKPPLDLVRLELNERLVGAKAARAWLAHVLGVSGHESDETPSNNPPARETIVEFLLSRRPGIFLIDELQYLLLRNVGGFSALREVLAVLHRTSHRHFWVVACHRSSWSYLAGVAINFHLKIFRQRIVLTPWTSETLAQWLEEGTRRAGFEPRFESLVPNRGRLRPKYRLDRAREAFWRLLGETSRGNPGVAMTHWLDSLCQARDQAEQGKTPTVDVTLVHGPTGEQVEALPGNDLFVLTALVLHNRMSGKHLAESLNLPPGPLEVTCRHLEGLGIIERFGLGDLAVSSRWYPAVVRVLRQKHFLHRS